MRRDIPRFAALAVAVILALTAGDSGQHVLAQSSAAEKVVAGPYTVDVGPRSATVMWLVQTGEASLGTDPANPDKAEPVLHARKAAFIGLKQGTTYYYQAFPGEAGKGSFKTPPAGQAAFQFVVYGDTRTRHDVHRRVIAAILRDAKPDFVLHTGDLVANGADAALWPIFFDAERELLRTAAFYPSLGNHERDAGNYFDFLDARPYYSFDWGNAHFTVIDSDIRSAGATGAQRDAFWEEQTRWLEDDLRGAEKAAFRFVFAHHPPITAVKHRQGSNPEMTALEPMFEKYRLSAGFFGHDHNYQHYLKDGVHYFVTGGGGAPLYDVDAPPAGITRKVARTENFVIVQVDGNAARIEARTPDGQPLDVTELSSAANKPPMVTENPNGTFTVQKEPRKGESKDAEDAKGKSTKGLVIPRQVVVPIVPGPQKRN